MPDTGMDPGGQPDTWRQREDWVCLKVAASPGGWGSVGRPWEKRGQGWQLGSPEQRPGTV